MSKTRELMKYAADNEMKMETIVLPAAERSLGSDKFSVESQFLNLLTLSAALRHFPKSPPCKNEAAAFFFLKI